MAVETEKLALLLEVQANQFDRALKRQNAQAARIFKQLEDRASEAERSIGGSFGTLGKRIAGVFAGIAVGSMLNDIRKVADEYTKIMNTLKVAGVKDADLSGTFDKLFASAQRNATPLDSLATLYGRVSAAQTTLKASSDEVMQVTDIVAQSLRVGGASATEASGAMLQLGQALAGGKVQAEEYNSLLDGMRPLLEAAAHGIKEAGGDVAQLTALVKDGKVSSEAFFRGIQAGAPILEQKLAGAAVTTEQAMQRLNNEFVKAIGEFDKATGSSAALASGINNLAGSIGGVGSAAAGAVNGVQALIAKVGELARANAVVQRQQALGYQAERAARGAQAREMGLANAGGRSTVAAEQAAANAAAVEANRKALAGFRQSEVEFANALKTTTQPPARPKDIGAQAIKPISLADYKVPGDKDGKGGGSSSKDKLDAYDRELLQIEKRTKALQLEAEMSGKSTFEREKAKAVLDLETAAKKANVIVTDEMRQKIDQSAIGYANARVKVEEVTKALEASREATRFFGDSITDALSDMIIDGEKAADVMKNLVKQLAKAALQAMLMGSGPLGGLFGGGKGLLGGLLGGIKLADGGWVSGPGTSRSDSVPARLSKGEFVVNAASAKRNAALLAAINTGKPIKMADGGFAGVAPLVTPKVPVGVNRGEAASKPSVTIVQHIAANGDRTVADIARRAAAEGISQYDRSLPSRIGNINKRTA